ncbi:MAG: SusC/RagA family TonB-linked outer membrane protein, partial [Muribaculaceae bacterium]|nr:SusC/RagA family TonB-linked outer membrane protein [Muribaculaceae bacterium]
MKKAGYAILRLIALMFCCFSVSWASAQTRVTGTVLDEEGEPLISASVVLKSDPKVAAITDIDGAFVINVPNTQAILRVSYIGYKTQEVALNGRNNVTVTLVTDNEMLDEMVVVGYGVQKKGSLTGSVSAVGAKELLKAPMQNMSNLLTGKVSGMTSLQQTGQPGADGAALYIRGISGFEGAAPLVLVDGVERDMNLVNPNDVESVSVLKDAAASIYGIRGANGVILITTKKGQGAPQISYAGSVSAIRNTAFPEFLNASEFMYYKNKALMMDGFAPVFTADIQQKVFENDPDSPWGETDWFDEIFRTGFMQQHNVSAAGSTDRVNYYTSIGYMDQQGTIKKTDFNRINARANLDIKVAKNLTFAVNMGGTKTHQDAPASNTFSKQMEINPVRQAANTAPVIKKEWNGYTLA